MFTVNLGCYYDKYETFQMPSKLDNEKYHAMEAHFKMIFGLIN